MPCLICGLFDQELRRVHDLGDARLVIGAQQRRAVAGDDVVADLVPQRGIFGDADDLRGIAGQHDVAALIVAHDLRLHVLAGAVRRGVHVRAEADDRHVLVGVRRHGRVDVAMLIEMGIGNADRPQFPCSRRPRFFCFSVEGQVGEAGSRLRVDPT